MAHHSKTTHRSPPGANFATELPQEPVMQEQPLATLASKLAQPCKFAESELRERELTRLC